MRIADRDVYITHRNCRHSWISRVLLGPKFMFYPQMFWVVWASRRKLLGGRYGDVDWAQSSLAALRVLENIGINVEITGMSHFTKINGPIVFIANHMSTLETFVLPCVVQPVKKMTFIVKKSLLTMPIFGPILRSIDPIVVGRVNPREDLKIVVEEGAKRLESGISLMLFPQSTRSVVFNPKEFNTLGIKLALKTGAPVVPIALKTDAWGIGKLFKDCGRIDVKKKVHFAFGEPMCVTGRGTKEHGKILRFIQEKLEQWDKPVT